MGILDLESKIDELPDRIWATLETRIDKALDLSMKHIAEEVVKAHATECAHQRADTNAAIEAAVIKATSESTKKLKNYAVIGLGLLLTSGILSPELTKAIIALFN